jgi:hypothetical protein
MSGTMTFRHTDIARVHGVQLLCYKPGTNLRTAAVHLARLGQPNKLGQEDACPAVNKFSITPRLIFDIL